jgi:hypothetical protein
LSASWKSLCREAGLRYEGNEIRIPCGNERSQRVLIEEREGDVIRIWSKVATRSQIDLEQPNLEAFLVNRYRELVGFKSIERGTIVGEAWVPMIDLSAEEWKVYVTTVARTCDRMEFLWTGRDES